MCQRREEQIRHEWMHASLTVSGAGHSAGSGMRAHAHVCMFTASHVCESARVAGSVPGAKAFSDLAKFASVGLFHSLPTSRRPSLLPNFPERLGSKARKLSCILLLLF